MSAESGLSRRVTAIILTVVVANLGNNIVAPLMPVIRDEFDSSAAQVALVASGFGLGRLVMDLPAGYLIGRISPNRMFTLGILLAAGAAALAAYSTTLEQLIAFRTAMGLGSSIMSTVALTLLARMARPEERGSLLGFYTSAMLFGQAISPTIGGYLATLFDWRAGFLFCALTPLVSLPLNLFATSSAADASLPEGGGEQRGVHGHGAAPITQECAPAPRFALASVYLGTFVNFFDRHGMRATLLPLYGGLVLAMDPGTIGATLTASSVLTILVSLPLGAASDRVGKKRLLLPGLLTLAAGNLFLLSGESQIVFTVATTLISMGVLSNSMLSALVADLVPEPLLGKGMGLYRFTADLGVVLGPVVLGLVVDLYGFGAASLVGAVAVLMGTAVCHLCVPQETGAVATGGKA